MEIVDDNYLMIQRCFKIGLHLELLIYGTCLVSVRVKFLERVLTGCSI